MDSNDPDAFCNLGMLYRDGDMGLPQDINKANELLLKAAELGSCSAQAKIAAAYHKGEAVEVDKDYEKGIQHLKLAAIGGHEAARHFLGKMAAEKRLAMKHFIIAARAGYDNALKKVGEGYKDEHVTKDEYASTLRAHQCIRDEMKSEQRDIAVVYEQMKSKTQTGTAV